MENLCQKAYRMEKMVLREEIWHLFCANHFYLI